MCVCACAQGLTWQFNGGKRFQKILNIEMTWYCCCFCFFPFFSLFFPVLLCDWHFSWIWHKLKNVETGKKCCRLSMLKFDTSKNQTNWAISENANDLVWLLLFISSQCSKLSGYPSRCRWEEKKRQREEKVITIVFDFFSSFFLVGFIFVKFMICSYIKSVFRSFNRLRLHLKQSQLFQRSVDLCTNMHKLWYWHSHSTGAIK